MASYIIADADLLNDCCAMHGMLLRSNRGRRFSVYLP